jgi:hypothetical protein
MAKSDKNEAVQSKPEPPISAANRFIYTGQTLPNGRLRHGAVFIGTREQVLQHFKCEIESDPSLKRAFVPVFKGGTK